MADIGIAIDPPRILEVKRAVTGIMTAQWDSMIDGRRYGFTVSLRGRTIIEARKEVETIWPGEWSWANGRGSRVERT